ncbi:phage capsid protein [Maricaulis sp.]|uniref:phage capsid protein n=1 Tax=Maricaulis sp. TaxID=1486257 RepID=UPI003299C13F
MSHQAPVLFTEKYEARVEHTFQRKKSKVFATVRNRTEGVIGAESLTMYVAGKGRTTKRPSRHADIPPMNAGRSKIKLTTEDDFASDYIDDEDLDKMLADDRDVVADQGAFAIARALDDYVVEEINGTDQYVGDWSEGMSVDLALQATTNAALYEWPDDEGGWYGLLGPNAWNQMLTYKQFASGEYVGDALPYLNKAYVRSWNGVTWMRHTGLVSPDTDQENGLLYYGPAIAAVGQRSGKPDIWWDGKKQAWLVTQRLRAGAKRHVEPCAIQLRYNPNAPFYGVNNTPAT